MDTCPAALRVAVVSPREIVACGIVSMLARHGDRIEVVDLGSRSLVADIDVVLVDEAALESADARRADAWAPAAKAVVLLTIEDELRFVDAAVRQGSLAGVVASDVDAADLLRVLETAASGDAPPALAVPGWQTCYGLSTREGDVLQLIVSGRTNAEICLLLNLSINSVKTYIRMAYRKIGVERRSQAVVWGLKHAGPPAEGTDEAVDLTR